MTKHRRMSIKNVVARLFSRGLNIGREFDDHSAFDPARRIPRVIYQTFPRKELPVHISSNIARLRDLNPNWEYRLFDDAGIIDFIRSNYPEPVLSAYLSINPKYGAARADLFRYLLIYRFGGVYLDVKSTVTRPLDEIVRDEDRFILSHWENRDGEQFAGWGLHREVKKRAGEFQQWHVISSPHHPFLAAVIGRVLRNIRIYRPVLHGTGHHGILRLTGPVAYTLAIEPLVESCLHRLINGAREGVEYSFMDKEGKAHKSLIGFHYETLNDAIVQR